MMRTPFKIVAALIALLAVTVAPLPVAAQQPVVFFRSVDAISGSASTTNADVPCILVKYVGTTAGKHTVETAAGGDVTFKVAAVADVTTGSASNGIFDLSTPAAGEDTWGEVVSLINTLGSNWRAVLVGCLASDLTDNTAVTLSAADANTPKGVALFRDSTVASATSVFSGQVPALPPGALTDIQFFLGEGKGGAPSASRKVNANPFANYQTFVQNIREKITSTGVIALFEVLGVTRTYDSTGKVTETVRSIWSETGAATTVEKAKDFNSGPLVGAPGELIVVRQRTATDLTAVQLGINGYSVRK